MTFADDMGWFRGRCANPVRCLEDGCGNLRTVNKREKGKRNINIFVHRERIDNFVGSELLSIGKIDGEITRRLQKENIFTMLLNISYWI